MIYTVGSSVIREIAFAAVAVGNEGDYMMIVIINHNNKPSPFCGTSG
jgi:hypothetical protein